MSHQHNKVEKWARRQKRQRTAIVQRQASQEKRLKARAEKRAPAAEPAQEVEVANVE